MMTSGGGDCLRFLRLTLGFEAAAPPNPVLLRFADAPPPFRSSSALSAALLLLPLAHPAAQDGDLARTVDEQARVIEAQEERIRRLEAMVEELAGRDGAPAPEAPAAPPSAGADASPAAAGGPLGGAGDYDPEKAFFPPAPRLTSGDGRYSTGNQRASSSSTPPPTARTAGRRRTSAAEARSGGRTCCSAASSTRTGSCSSPTPSGTEARSPRTDSARPRRSTGARAPGG